MAKDVSTARTSDEEWGDGMMRSAGRRRSVRMYVITGCSPGCKIMGREPYLRVSIVGLYVMRRAVGRAASQPGVVRE